MKPPVTLRYNRSTHFEVAQEVLTDVFKRQQVNDQIEVSVNQVADLPRIVSNLLMAYERQNMFPFNIQ